MNLFSWLGRKKYSHTTKSKPDHPLPPSARSEPISLSLEHNLHKLGDLFTDTPDMIIRTLVLPDTGEQAALVYLEGLSDKNAINNNVIKPIAGGIGSIESASVTVGRVGRLREWGPITNAILKGSSVLFIDGRTDAILLGTEGWPQRAIEDPQLETSLKGAHQGFIESSGQNIALLRRYLPHQELKIREHQVGRRGDTRVSIIYIADVTNPEVLKELEDRIRHLDVDVIINTGELAELIEDNPYSPFPQLLLTERPDTAASQLVQGRIVVLVDRSPSVIVGPATFVSFFQSVDDYSTRWSIATFIRMLRFFAFFVAICLPAFYIAVSSYNFELIPVKLLLTIGEYRGSVPFSPFIEAIFMEITLEMMREAGVRLPAPVGQTVGIVGGIVIGQAIVQAGLISNIMVIVVSFTAIASFILPNYDFVAGVRIIRFLMMIAASFFGLFGIVVGLMTLTGHLISLESLGTPFGSPFAPMRWSDWKDTFVRAPLWKMIKRPVSTKALQSIRQGDNKHKGEGS
ncbi:spore germination protein [Paenibacillus cellulosilyticus]|uniref:Spore germination protein n=1 Tax=Paenibacillus cellulosilyticus TaxID=375489 RepID=A0A2V2YZQ6_9BACL|nr:spore germination protein [Paenibacillus cellulosilyticus]PWV99444.1 spore germination protein [Paenibacillus cellulosilyticus]QKS44702.1 spore germination protein [Paenibacillus cellulosilyticus]